MNVMASLFGKRSTPKLAGVDPLPQNARGVASLKNMEPETELMTEFPIARSDSVMIVREGKLMLWGGYTQTIWGEGDDRFIVAINLPDTDKKDRSVEVCDLSTMEWHRQQTTGANHPVFGKGAFSGVVGNHLYVFGGLDDEDYRNDLHRLSFEDFAWKPLSTLNGPSAKSYGGMVAHGECVIVLGGLGKKQLQPSFKGAEVIKDKKFDGDFSSEWNNSIHEYNTVTDKWRELGCTGARPPPLERFSFDKIDSHRALLFGGKQGLFAEGLRHIYILDLETMVWEGPYGPSGPDQPWPVGRGVHATTCLVDPESELAASEQQIIVFWGDGKDAIHLPDIWILHVQSRTWKEVKLSLTSRKYHMCTSHYRGGKQTDVIVYGGNKRRKSKFERNVMTDMIIFRFGCVRDLQDMCIRCIREMDNYQQMLSLLPPSLRQKVLDGESSQHYSLYYPTEFMKT